MHKWYYMYNKNCENAKYTKVVIYKNNFNITCTSINWLYGLNVRMRRLSNSYLRNVSVDIYIQRFSLYQYISWWKTGNFYWSEKCFVLCLFNNIQNISTGSTHFMPKNWCLLHGLYTCKRLANMTSFGSHIKLINYIHC